MLRGDTDHYTLSCTGSIVYSLKTDTAKDGWLDAGVVFDLYPPRLLKCSGQLGIIGDIDAHFCLGQRAILYGQGRGSHKAADHSRR